MKKVIKVIEITIELITVVLSILTILEGIKAWKYRRKLAQKAQDYLEDEFIPEANLGKTINVYSPMLTKNRNKVMALLAATGASCILIVVIKFFNWRRD